jgi:hypothetical protein
MKIPQTLLAALAWTLLLAGAPAQSRNLRLGLRRCGALLLASAALRVGAADLSSNFDASAEDWRASTNTATLTWQSTGGTPGGYLRGTRSGSTNLWYFLSPTNWAGDWSSYKVLKFDFSIPTRHYPDLDRAGLVVIVGTNGQQMTWTASTPLWTWTHYEVGFKPSAFNVDQATYDSIMTNVAELRILAEVTTATEAVGLDNVLVTATPPQAYTTDLVSRFGDGTTQGWRPVDDVTLSVVEDGRPTQALKADDWMDGRTYRIATPTNWAGDWRGFLQLDFDMWWQARDVSFASVELVRIFGANGQSLVWSGALSNNVWIHRSIPLRPESFNVTAAEFEGVMAHVSDMWIRGEFTDADDITYLDNVVLSTGTNGPPRWTQNIVSRFDTDAEGWKVYDNATMTWLASGGVSGGTLRCVDQGTGLARFQTPDAWAGDWRAFRTIGFALKPGTSALSTYPTALWILTWDGRALYLDLPQVPGSWTPITVDLTPATFGVSQADFDAIMGDVACAWIRADIMDGNDTTLLDNVALLTETGAGLPPDRSSDFESGAQGWRRGAWNTGSGRWAFAGGATHVATGGNPGGFIRNHDEFDWTYWFSPESWAGDWRGLESVSFDFKIISGSDLFGTRMVSIISAWTNLHADVVTLPVPGQWRRYEFALTPATFGVSSHEFEQVMRDVVALGIRSEWISGAEQEGLDNFRLWAGAPALTVMRSNNAVVVSWTASAEGWVLEATNALPSVAAPWPQVAPLYQTNSGTISVIFTNTPATGNQFFRLHKP